MQENQRQQATATWRMRREVDPDVYCPQAALVSEELNRKTEQRLARYRAKYEAAKLHQEMALQQQRQQRSWMVGGTLVVVALSWIWYKRKHAQKQRRTQGKGENLPKDLLLDEDDGFDGTDEELLQVFDEAAKVARKLPHDMLDQRDQLMLYGLYKQAKEGDRNVDAPSKLNVVAYAKYEAWGKFTGLPKQFAMKKYCEVVYHFSNGGESSFSDGNDVDLDEDGCPINADGDDLGGEMTGMGIRQSTLSGSQEAAKSRNEAESSTPEVCLRDAAISNDVTSLKKAIGDVHDINDADDSGQTALHFAADRGSVDCLKLLVEYGANLNAVDCDGIGIIQTALSAGLGIESVRMLLEAGANPDDCDVDGDSPRMWVSEEGDKDLVDLFASFNPAR